MGPRPGEGPGLVPAALSSNDPTPTPAPPEPVREVVPPLDPPFAAPEPPPPAPQVRMAPAPAPAEPAPAPQVRAAPAPAAPPAPARASQPLAEVRSGDEHADALASVIRAARARGVDVTPGDDASRGRAKAAIEQAARTVNPLPAGTSHDRLAREALAELAGFGALEAVFEDAEIASATVDHVGRVSTVRNGQRNVGSHWFSSPSAAAECVERLLRAHGIDRAGRNAVHATLADGTRVIAVFGPLAHAGAVVQIERNVRALNLNDLGARGALPPQALGALSNALGGRRNVIVVGPRGSGRTNVLSSLIASLPASDLAVAVEDRDELGRARRDALSIRADGDWEAAVSVALSIHAGRVVYGEANGATAKAFVAGLTTGAEGSMIAVAAPTGAAGLAKLSSLGTQEGWLPQHEAATRILTTRPLVIETGRLGDGQARIVGIGEVGTGADGSLQVAQLFALRIDGTDAAGNLHAQLVPTNGY